MATLTCGHLSLDFTYREFDENGRLGFKAWSDGYESVQPCSGNYLYGECDRPQGVGVGWGSYSNDPIAYHATYLTARFFLRRPSVGPGISANAREEPGAHGVLLSPPATCSGCGASGPCRSWKVSACRCPQFLVEALAPRTGSGSRPLSNLYRHRRLSQPTVAHRVGYGDVSETRFRCGRQSTIFRSLHAPGVLRARFPCAVGNDRGQPKPAYG
jgi:hypothetical protein